MPDSTDRIPIGKDASLLDVINGVAQRGWQLSETKFDVLQDAGETVTIVAVKKSR